MTNMWHVEIRGDGFDWDYGSTHFCVFAKTEKEAWKEACKLTDKKDIVRLWWAKTI